MPEIQPRVEIDLAPPAYDDFVIEELTFNPFISMKSRNQKGLVVDLWMELLIKRVSGGASPMNVPTVVLTLNENLSHLQTLTCSLPEVPGTSAGADDDMNFVMHSDIWYSFVRLDDRDHEFMTTGYNRPIRIHYPCFGCTEADADHTKSELWMKGGNHAFAHPSPWHDEVEKLLRKMRLFDGDAIHSSIGARAWSQAPWDVGTKRVKTLVLVDHKRYAPVHFEVLPDKPKGRFGVRRLPWKMDPQNAGSEMYGVSYGGTAEISYKDEAYRLTPVMFDPKKAGTLPAKLDQSEGIRFWIRWQSTCAVDLDVTSDRISFATTLSVRPKLQQFNTFFRVPEGFELVPGSKLEHYPVPPRLFFFWSSLKAKPDQCFSMSMPLSQTGGEIQVVAEFVDKSKEIRRLIVIFALSFTINIAVGLGISALFSSIEEESFIGRLHLKCSPFIAGTILLLAAVQEYRRVSFKLVPLGGLLAASFLVVAAFQRGTFSFCAVAVLVAGLAVWTFGLPNRAKAFGSRLSSVTDRAQRIWTKWKYLRRNKARR